MLKNSNIEVEEILYFNDGLRNDRLFEGLVKNDSDFSSDIHIGNPIPQPNLVFNLIEDDQIAESSFLLYI